MVADSRVEVVVVIVSVDDVHEVIAKAATNSSRLRKLSFLIVC